MKELLSKIFGKKLSYSYKIINIYVDKDNKLKIIPTGESQKFHLTTELNEHIDLAPPYSDTELEQKLFEAMDLCFSYKPIDISFSSNVEKANSSKSYNKQVKGKRLISVFWNIEDGYMVEPTKRPKGGRGFSTIEEKIIRLGKTLSPGDLANAIKNAIDISEPF